MKKPSSSGSIIIPLEYSLVSQQSRSDARIRFTDGVRSVTSSFEFLLSGDVSVLVEWFIDERTRYETDRAPDVDNVLKPILDALTGPDGVLIDDNQVQHVSCHWIDCNMGEHANIIIHYSPYEWVRKNGLFFIQIDNGLCIPVANNIPEDALILIISRYKDAFKLRATFDSIDPHSEIGSAIMPIQRAFHRTRLRDYRILTENDAIARDHTSPSAD